MTLSTRLSPLYSLTHATIDSALQEKSPGVYVLDRSSHGSFSVAFIGRSNDDVKAALHKHVGNYRFFKYAYCSSAKFAFEAECELYHAHHHDDHAHPENESGWACPLCRPSI